MVFVGTRTRALVMPSMTWIVTTSANLRTYAYLMQATTRTMIRSVLYHTVLTWIAPVLCVLGLAARAKSTDKGELMRASARLTQCVTCVHVHVRKNVSTNAPPIPKTIWTAMVSVATRTLVLWMQRTMPTAMVRVAQPHPHRRQQALPHRHQRSQRRRQRCIDA